MKDTLNSMKDIKDKLLSHDRNASKYADRWEKHSGKKDFEQMLYHSQKAKRLRAIKSVQALNTSLSTLYSMKGKQT